MNVADHVIFVPWVKMKWLENIHYKQVKNVLLPENEKDLEVLTNAMRKEKLLSKTRKTLQPHELIIIVSDKNLHGMKLVSIIYGKDAKSQWLATKKIEMPDHKTDAIIMIENETHFKKLKLPDYVQKRLVSYMKSMDKEKDDCGIFMMHMMWIPQALASNATNLQTTDSKEAYEKLVYQESDSSTLTPWDAILLSTWEKKKHHAIYLGEWLYISKLGPTSGLAITTLSQLNKMYFTNNIQIHRRLFNISNIKEILKDRSKEELDKIELYKKAIENLY